MSELEPFAEDCLVRLIIEAGQLAGKDPGLDSSEKLVLRSAVKSLLIDCQIIDSYEQPALRELAVSLLETGYKIGASSRLSETSCSVTKTLRSKAGVQSGQRRLKDAEEGWRSHATELAVAERAKDPGRSQANLAADIQNSWKKKGKVPGIHSLLQHISRVEKAGALPKRVAN